MQEDTLSFVELLIAFVLLALLGGALIAGAVHSQRRSVRFLLTMSGCATVVAFAAIVALLR